MLYSKQKILLLSLTPSHQIPNTLTTTPPWRILPSNLCMYPLRVPQAQRYIVERKTEKPWLPDQGTASLAAKYGYTCRVLELAFSNSTCFTLRYQIKGIQKHGIDVCCIILHIKQYINLTIAGEQRPSEQYRQLCFIRTRHSWTHLITHLIWTIMRPMFLRVTWQY